MMPYSHVYDAIYILIINFAVSFVFESAFGFIRYFWIGKDAAQTARWKSKYDPEFGNLWAPYYENKVAELLPQDSTIFNLPEWERDVPALVNRYWEVKLPRWKVKNGMLIDWGIHYRAFKAFSSEQEYWRMLQEHAEDFGEYIARNSIKYYR